ncbi:SusC/RagA family TonB-linked outer membrane protein [Winogradskyella sp. F6397]|uniref:SusC/RagA family TonB-linked outer membrane protein n=1 Tax=Winogradskyella marina TaxID=2785530 RepID=A0ABS0EI97_9FLAO|nr:SusC/RagA family TonB-linked outer membrane protein [Winogradskyella marina]MBF8150107.1 SusC/RagA family TonB-linked outer membrane protein [Winogradskyella marina]
MKLKLTWLLTLFMAFVMQFSFAQEKTVTGTVTTAMDGLPLPGANVIVKGTSKGQQTDFDGKFTIQVNQGDVLVVSYVGMAASEVKIGAANTYDVALKESSGLDEVIVVGYSNVSKATSKAATVRVSAKTIENRPNASFVQTLSGQVAGLNITTSSGQPGGNSLVNLRGVSSINGNTEPLFIIDGAPVDEDNFRSLNPQDIESIDVLKDAGATAIYGNRGANGVIVIKTRQGSFDQGLKIAYNGFVSFSTLQDNDYNRMDSQQLLTYERDRGLGAGGGVSNTLFASGAGRPALTDAEIEAAPNFDWLDFFFRTAVTQSHTMSMSSGSENASQFTSFGFQDTQGVLEDSDLKRFNIRSNINGKSNNDRFKYGVNLTVNYSKSNEPNEIGGTGVNRNYVLGAFQSVPYITPGDYTNGEDLVNFGTPFAHTPLFLLDRLETYTRFEEEVKAVGSLNLSYSLTDWLTARAVMSGDYQSEFLTRAEGPTSFNAFLFGGAENPTSGFQTQQSTRQFSYNQVTSLNASKVYGKHTVDLGLFTEYFKAHFRGFGYAQDGLDPATFHPGDGSAFIAPAGGLFADLANANRLDAGLFSYFGALDYDYDERYGFGATVRRDASYRFAESNRWGTFWSVSGRWNISNESFMDGSVINNLKLRGSYGTAGNQDIVGLGYFGGPDLTLDLFTTTGGYGNQNSIALAQLGNRSLKWETVTSLNVGVDFGVWQNRLRGAIDVYERVTSDLFQSTPLSAVTGLTSQDANVGELVNRGFDFQVNYGVVQNIDGFNLNVGLVGNYNTTELRDLPNENGEIIGLGQNGGILNEYYTLRYVGVNPANGNLLYLTAEGDVTENPDADTDRVWIDKNLTPDWNGGFTLDMDYKGFYLTTQWNYVIGVDRFDNDYAGLVDPTAAGQFNASTDLLRAWSQPGDITDIPSYNAANLNSFPGSDRFLRSADFLRLRFASFGYNFPTKFLEGTGFSNASIFVNGENLVTFTEWRGFDPETRTNVSRQYPTPRTFSVGFELGF